MSCTPSSRVMSSWSAGFAPNHTYSCSSPCREEDPNEDQQEEHASADIVEVVS